MPIIWYFGHHVPFELFWWTEPPWFSVRTQRELASWQAVLNTPKQLEVHQYSFKITSQSWTPIISTWLYQIPCYRELKTISLGFAFQSFTLGYFKLLLFQTIYYFPTKFEIVGFIVCSVSFETLYCSSPEELQSSGLITTRVWLILFPTLTKWNDDSTNLKP